LTSKDTTRLVVALIVAAVIFALTVISRRLFGEGALPLFASQLVELSLSLVAIAVLGRFRFAEYGFCMPKRSEAPRRATSFWAWIFLLAFLVGAIASIAMVLSGAGGNPLIAKLSLPQIVLIVWISSSTIEEVFTRGFLQGHLSPLSGIRLNLGVARVELPVLISALFFACMHLSLLLAGAEVTSVVIIWLFTFTLGLLAALARARSGSLLPAIGVHMLGNFGGFIGGVVVVIIRFLSGHGPGV